MADANQAPGRATPSVSRIAPPAFKPLAGVHVLMKGLPADVLDACRATKDVFSLNLMSGIWDKAWVGQAKSPDRLAERFQAPNKVCAVDIPIHLEVNFEELAQWQLDPKISILAYYPLDKEDLPNVLYALGYFGAIIVDLKIYRDDLQDAVSWLHRLNGALGEVVVILPRDQYEAFSQYGAPGPTGDPARTVPIRIMDGLALIFAREAVSPDERFAADNDTAAWCDALDYASLSPRLELKTRHERVGGVKQKVMGAHYWMVRRSGLYRRFANRVAVTDSALDVLMQRAANDLEYMSWRLFRSGKRK